MATDFPRMTNPKQTAVGAKSCFYRNHGVSERVTRPSVNCSEILRFVQIFSHWREVCYLKLNKYLCSWKGNIIVLLFNCDQQSKVYTDLMVGHRVREPCKIHIFIRNRRKQQTYSKKGSLVLIVYRSPCLYTSVQTNSQRIFFYHSSHWCGWNLQ